MAHIIWDIFDAIYTDVTCKVEVINATIEIKTKQSFEKARNQRTKNPLVQLAENFDVKWSMDP